MGVNYRLAATFHQRKHPKIWIELRHRTPRQVITKGSIKRTAQQIVYRLSAHDNVLYHAQ